MHNLKKSALAIILVAALSGCSTVSKDVANYKPNFYPQCWDPIAKLCQDRDYSKQVNSAVSGAVAGAIVGALLGAMTGKSENVARGMAVGAVAGGMTGAITSSISKYKDRRDRLDALSRMLGEDANGLDLEKTSVLAAFRCYENEALALKQQVKDRQISTKDANLRIDEIKVAVGKLKTFWDERSKDMGSRIADYQNNIVREARQVDQADQIASLRESAEKAGQLRNQRELANAEVNELYSSLSEKLDISMS